MSYQMYDGTIKAKASKDKDAPCVGCELSDIIEPGLHSQDSINQFIDKYGRDLVNDWIYKHWKVQIQKVGQQLLKQAIDSGEVINYEAIEMSMRHYADGDMQPVRKKKAPLTSADIRRQAEIAGIGAKKIEGLIQSLLDSGKIKE